MKKYRLPAFAAIVALVGLCIVPIAAHADSNFRTGMSASVGKNETVDASAYLAGSTVTVAGDIRGDLYCAGQTVDISGTVEGDVICAGQTVTISGTVLGNVRVAGQNVALNGQVGRSVTAFGQSVTLASGATVTTDATMYASSLQLDGKVGRDAVIGGQAVTVGGMVGRNATVVDRQLSLGSAAHIGGTLDYTSNNEVQMNTGAVVAGQTQRHAPPTRTQSSDNSFAAHFWGVAYWFGAILVFGLFLLGLAPRSYHSSAQLMTAKLGWALLTGVVALVMAPIMAVLLMVTVIGLPAGLALLFLWLVALLASFAYSSYALGQWLAERAAWKLMWPSFSALVLGLVVLSLLMLIPFIGGLCSFLALIWGLGGIVLLCGRHFKTRHGQPRVTKKATA